MARSRSHRAGRRRRIGLALLVVLLIGGLYIYLSPTRREPLAPGKVGIPEGARLSESNDSAYARAVLDFWCEQPLGNWRKKGKGDEPRTMLARLRARHLVPETNEYLLSLKPWGTSGSTWQMNKNGDYDFTLTVLTSILWLYGEDETRLNPATRDHLLKVLLNEDGNAFRATVPGTLGVVKETENHLLMTEGSRYLKNRWLHEHDDSQARFDNTANGMEERLLTMLDGLKTAGLHEFNSQPYIGYTLTALLNLEAFGSTAVRSASRELLDQLNWHYALGSYQFRHYPPFRRRSEYASMTSLNSGYQTVFMNMWSNREPNRIPASKVRKSDATHALMALCLPYRPLEEVVQLVSDKGEGYFARIGHGPGGSPEIFGAGEKFLLSAGGVNRGRASQVVARPSILLLDDGATDLSEVFHLAGPGDDFRTWNNTGVYKNFACAAGPVQVPAHLTPVQTKGAWKLYEPSVEVSVVVYSTTDMGLMLVLEKAPSDQILEEIVEANPEATMLKHGFQFPGGLKLSYDLQSPKDRWIMTGVGEKPLDRDFDTWPMVEIE